MANLFLSDSFDVLRGYFVGDAVNQANTLIADKVKIAWNVLNASTAPLSTTVNAAATQLIQEYAPNTLAAWQGGARVIINGTSLSSNSADLDYSISSIDFVFTATDTPTDWAHPLAKVSMGLQLTVAGGRANALSINSVSADAGNMHAAFTGPIQLDSVANTGSMPNARFEVSYDSDPGAAVVLSHIYFQGGLSFNVNTGVVDGTFNEFGLTNDAGHYFYGTGLNITAAALRALPATATETDMLRAVFNGTTDTVYTKTDVVLPEGFENAVIEGTGNTAVTGNTQNNQITGNSGNNVIDGGAGVDTFVTQGTFAQSTGVLNADGSVTLTAAGGGADTLTGIEQVKFSDLTKPIAAVIDSAQLSYTTDSSRVFSATLPQIKAGDGIVSGVPSINDWYGFEEKGLLLSTGKLLSARNVRAADGSYQIEVTCRSAAGVLDESFGSHGVLNIAGFAGFLSMAESSDGHVFLSQSAPYNYGFITGLNDWSQPKIYSIGQTGTVTTVFGAMAGSNYSPVEINKLIAISNNQLLAIGNKEGAVCVVKLTADASGTNLSAGAHVLLDIANAFGSNNDYVQDAVVDSVGRIYLLSDGNGDPGSYLTRLNADLSVDASFSPGTPFHSIVLGTSTQKPLGIDLDSKGNVLVAFVKSGDFANKIIEIDRIKPDGSYDTTFGGGDGKAEIPLAGDFGWTPDGVALLSIDSNDRPVLAFDRYVMAISTRGTEVIRLQVDGTVDKILTQTDAGYESMTGSSSVPIMTLAAYKADFNSESPQWIQIDAQNNIYVGVKGSQFSILSQSNSQTYAIAKFTAAGGVDRGFDEVSASAYHLTSYDGLALPTGLVFDPVTATISGGSTLQIGTYYLTLSATGSGGTFSESFALNVLPFQNDAPTLVNPLVNRAAFEGDTVNIQLPAGLFSDPDIGDSVTITAGSLPNWLSFHPASGTNSATITGVVPVGAANPGAITFTATDTHGATTSSTFNFSVLKNFVSSGQATLHISDSFAVLNQYFAGEAINQANMLIAEKVKIAWDILNASTAPSSNMINGAATQLIEEYAPNTLASWKGGARVIVNGTSLSTNPADLDYSISSIDFILTSTDAPSDWSHPLAKASLGLQFSVSGGRATTLSINSASADAGNLHAAFSGTVSIDATANVVNMPNASFDVAYDSDPGVAVVLSHIYLRGGLSLDVNTGRISGVLSEFGLINDAGHYFYGAGLSVTAAEIQAMPANASAEEYLRTVFESTSDTVYTATDVVLPEGFENAVIEGRGNTVVTGNTQNNQITGNSGNNVIDGGAGVDTFVTQGTFAQSTGVLNADGSVTLTAAGGGADTLTGIEQVKFSDLTKPITAVIDSGALTYTVDPSKVVSISPIVESGFLTQPAYKILGRDGQVALSNNGEFVAQGLSNGIDVTDTYTDQVHNFSIPGAAAFANYAPVAVSDSGEDVFFVTWNDLNPSNQGYGGLYKYHIDFDHSGEGTSIVRLDTNAAGQTFTYQGWGVEANQVDVSSNGRYVAFQLRDTWGSGQKNNIYVKDSLTGLITKIDQGNNNGFSSNPKVSDDGRYVLFESNAELTPDDVSDGPEPLENQTDLFIADLVNHSIARVNVGTDGTRYDAGGYGWSADMSADGRIVTFTAGGSYQHQGGTPDGLPDPNGGTADVFVKYLDTGRVERISGSLNGGIYPHISPDGSFVEYMPYVYATAIQQEIVKLDDKSIYRAPGVAFTSKGSYSNESLVALGNDSGVLWTWNSYPGDTDGGDADYLYFHYAQDVRNYRVTNLDGSAIPNWLIFNSDTLEFRVSDPSISAQTLYLKLSGDLPSGQAVMEGFSLEVRPFQNDAPVVAQPLANLVAYVGYAVNIALPSTLFSDPDLGDSVTVSSSSLPSWLTFHAATAGSAASITGTVPSGSSGALSITITGTDAHGGQATSTFSLTTSLLDTVAPYVTAFNPTDAATGVATGSNLVFTLSEAAGFGYGNISIRTDSGQIVASIPAGNSQLSLSGQTLTINPTVDLSPGTHYNLTMDAGFLSDASGNSSTVLTGYDFTTTAAADTTMPELTTSSPADNATAVAVGNDVCLTFNEAVKAGAGNILLTNTANSADTRTIAVTDSTQISISGATLTINPSADLLVGAHYAVTMAPGVIKDIAGNDFSGITSSTALDFTMVTPAYALTGTPASVSEGNSVVFTVATTNVAANTALSYTLSGAGITAADIGGATLTGTTTVGADGTASFTLNLTADQLTEGSETLTATVQGQSASVTVNDTSTTVANTPRTKYFVLSSSAGANFTDFDLAYGSVTLAGEQVTFVGSSAVDAVFVRPGVTVDFTLSGSGVDKVYLGGSLASYTASITGSVMSLRRGSGSSLESVSFIKSTSAVSSDSVVFADGTLNSLDLYNNLKTATALPALSTTETSIAPLAPAAVGSVLNASIKAFALNAAGDTFAPSHPGVAMTVVGNVGVDTVYVPRGGTVDCTLLGSGQDLIYFTGNWGDYAKAISGSVETFSRTVNGYNESVRVVGSGTTSLNDQLVFADGAVHSADAKAALLTSLTVAISAVAGYDPTMTTPGLAPSVNASALNGAANLEVGSNLVLNYSESVTAVAGKYIHIVNDGGTGFHGESTVNTLNILVTDSSQVTIVGGRVTLNPTADLDLANNYHITMDAGAFTGASSHQVSLAYEGTSTLHFSTVTPGVTALANAAASQVMNTDGTLGNGHLWLDIEGIGGVNNSSGTALDLSANNYALVAKDYDPAGGSPGNDGIRMGDFYVAANNFGAGDLLYIDNQGGAANDLTQTNIINYGSPPTTVQFAGTGLGGLVDISLAGTVTTFDTVAQMKALLAASTSPVISA